MILENLDKNNLHHAYLIEGGRDEVVPKIVEFLGDIGIKTVGNPDFTLIVIDNFKIDEAFNLRSMSTDKSFSSAKKVFIVAVNSFSLEAQNVLLKIFEEPIENTHFFLIVPDANVLLKTLISRFYFVKAPTIVGAPTKVGEAEKFIALPHQARINFIKDLLVDGDEEDEDGNEIAVLDSARSKALKFLNELETVLSKKFSSQNYLQTCLEHIFKVRKFLRMPGSSAKSLMESVALIIPEKI